MSLIGKLSLFAVMTSVAVGCASPVQYAKFPNQSKRIDNPAMARIYVVRPSGMGAAVKMQVRDGKELIGATGAKSFLCWERKPGAMTVVGEAENTFTLPVETQRGNVYYVQQHMRMGVITARNKLSLLGEAKGKAALLKCKPPKVIE